MTNEHQPQTDEAAQMLIIAREFLQEQLGREPTSAEVEQAALEGLYFAEVIEEDLAAESLRVQAKAS